MRPSRQGLAAVALVIAIAIVGAACNQPASDKGAVEQPAIVEAIDGSDLARVTLSQRAAERLGIETTDVWVSLGKLAVPSSALWLDPGGTFWVYTNPEPLVYVRHAVTVDDDNGEVALLSAGPSSETRVVSVGVSELYGTEFGVGK